MDAIEKRARDLLAEGLVSLGWSDMSQDVRSGAASIEPHVLHALTAALTPPEGYVLVPSVLPEKMLDALYCAEGDMCDDDMQKLWKQLLAARPEVP